MTIEDLYADEDLRNWEFPVTARQVFLGNAAVCPLPRRAAEAMNAYLGRCMDGDQEEAYDLAVYHECRSMSAELLECERDDIALIGPTSVGLSLIANGLDWKAGDNVIYSPDDYPSNAVVWMNLQKKGVEARALRPSIPGRITPADVEAACDEKTRLVALASTHFITGWRLDVGGIGAVCREQGALFSVDGIQSVGALHTPTEYVDFMPADSHKWLLGPCSAGLVFVSKEARGVLEPTLLGWHNVICPNFTTPDEIRYRDDARRYEAGTNNLVGLVGMHASLQMILDLGIDSVEKAILAHTRRIREGVVAKGYTLAGPDENLSGISSFRKDGIDMAALHHKLTTAGIHCSLRQTRDGRSWLRFSPHFYNTPAEIQRAVSLL